jgi:hypothetical protein
MPFLCYNLMPVFLFCAIVVCGCTVTKIGLLIYHLVELRWFFAAAGLRNRSIVNKAQIVSEVEKNVWPAVVSGKVKPVVYKTFPLSEAAESHKLMESSSHIGKILLIPWLGMYWGPLWAPFLLWTMHGCCLFLLLPPFRNISLFRKLVTKGSIYCKLDLEMLLVTIIVGTYMS